MNPNPSGKAGQLFEYFLYTAIILETGLAVFVYKTAFQDAGLGSLKIYFGLLYCAFLAWAIGQLNKLHRKRRLLEPAIEPEPEFELQPYPLESETDSAPVRTPGETRPLLGLTIAQFAIVVIVFGTAVATFSWGLSVLRSGK